MDEFAIYSMPTNARELSGNPDPVESGLSAGECRQSLLDRFRADLDAGRERDVKRALKARGADVKTIFSTHAQAVDRIDDYLYDLPDVDLLGLWDFHGERIFVLEESE